MHKSGLVELEAVVAVARRGNFRAAAADLGMSSSALSHAVRGLEARLGVRLFNRTTRSVSLSAAGEQFVAGVAPALSDIRGAMEAVNRHRDTPAGTLRLNTSAGAARRILTPIVLEYLRRYPEMKVDLVTEGRLIDIVVDGFDAGIRMAETVPGDMIAVPIGGTLRFAVVAAPAYFADRPPPQTPGDLMAHRCIRARMPSGVIYRWEFERRGEALALDVPGPIILDEPTLMIEAALAGLGVAYLSEWSVLADIAAGRLVRVLEDWTPSFPGLALYYPGRRHVPAGLRALIELVREIGELPDRRAPA
jgi:DNA-binding transcriptional LysR family regulator